MPLWSRTGSAAGFGLGGSAASAGDLDGDGVGDVLIANRPTQPFVMEIQVLSGSSGAALATWSDPYEASAFGQALDGAGDVNGDGSIELVVGAPAEGGPALPIGAVGLVTFQCGIAVSLGAPCNPAAPHPSLMLDGCAVGAAAMTLSLTNGVPQAPTIVCASVNPMQVAVGGGCSWFVGVPFVAVGPFPLTQSGSFFAAVDLPAQAQQLTFILQAALADPAAATGFALSDAVFVALP